MEQIGQTVPTCFEIMNLFNSIQYLGVNPFAMQEIRDNFKKYAKADVFMFDSYNPQKTLIKLRKIL